MAAKVAPPPADPAATDLAVLYPDQAVTVAGQPLTVREFRFREGLDVTAEARAFLEDLRALIRRGDVRDDAVLSEIAEIAQRHADAWVGWIARACDRDRAWVEGLRQADRRTIEMAFWRANQAFFLNPLIADFVLAHVLDARSATPSSSPTSSAPGSETTSTTSDGDSPGASSGGSMK